MTEAVNLFQGICSNAYFKRSSIILFLNKKDLFAEKLAVRTVVVCFSPSTLCPPCFFFVASPRQSCLLLLRQSTRYLCFVSELCRSLPSSLLH